MYTNDPVKRQLTLDVQADLGITLGLEPQVLTFGSVFRNEGATREVKLIGRDAEKTKVLSVSFKAQGAPDDPALEGTPIVQARPQTSDTPRAIEVSISPEAAPGPFGGQITVVTDNPENPELTLLVRGVVHGGVAFRPQRLTFKNVEAGIEQTRTVTISATDKGPVEVLGVEADHPALTASVVSTKGGVTQIAVKCKGKIDRPQSARLVVRTSSTEDAQVQVPVLMYPAAKPPAPAPAQPAAAGHG